MIISALYSSVGHGGASGYLAVLSLTSYGIMSNLWLKQHVWVMNLVVASFAFYHYNRAGFHKLKLTLPFVITSIPMAFVGGMLSINPDLYDLLLSFTLLWAAYKITGQDISLASSITMPNRGEAYLWGGGIGFCSGVIGVGGGIFLSPILLLKKWADVKTAAATASLFIFVNSLSGLVGMGVTSQLDFDFSLLVILLVSITTGGFIGSLYGAKYARPIIVRRMLAIVLVIAAAKRVTELLSW